MNSKTMLFQCLGDCKETYLADNLCDGYRCPECDGFVVDRGLIKELEENAREVQDKINRAKENGLIRKYNAPVEPKQYIWGLDSAGDERDFTIRISIDASQLTSNLELINKQLQEAFERFRREGIKLYIEQIEKIKDLTKIFDDLKKHKRAGVIE